MAYTTINNPLDNLSNSGTREQTITIRLLSHYCTRIAQASHVDRDMKIQVWARDER